MEVALTIVPFKGKHYLLWLHTAYPPSAGEWERCFQRLRETKIERNGETEGMRTLALSDGAAPNRTQRLVLFREILPHQGPSAGVTTSLDNPVIRGVATALGWLNPTFRAIRPEQINEALAHMQIDRECLDVLWPAFVEMQKLLPPNETLRRVAKTLGRSV